ncbi:hypothetical protein Vafri_21955 [Volvox africanus]|uniref:Uncharacterized protein n=1 Tax=Volvox africanus TaxID=51714 RepID=A0A8J4BTG7_9CHLO|nr:hypothetical protein Vafri_21955 [Volvox africanus]
MKREVSKSPNPPLRSGINTHTEALSGTAIPVAGSKPYFCPSDAAYGSSTTVRRAGCTFRLVSSATLSCRADLTRDIRRSVEMRCRTADDELASSIIIPAAAAIAGP